MRADPARVDAEAAQRVAYVGAERVVADLGDDRRARAQPRGGDRHVGRAAAQRLGERAHVGQVHADLLGVEVDADAAHGDEVEGHAATSRAGATCSPYGPWTVWSKSMTEPVTIRAASLSR